MKKLPVHEAVGQALFHDLTAITAEGFKGPRFSRGHVITAEDIPTLLDMGKGHVYVGAPREDEVHEDEAAQALAKALCGESIRFEGPSEGKFLFAAEANGLFCVDTQALQAINSVEDYTVALRPNHSPVQAGEKLGGARIIPLVTKRKNMEEAVALAQGSAPVLSVRPYRPLKCGLVITGDEVFYGRIPDLFEPVMRRKVQAFGGVFLGAAKAPDQLSAIQEAIAGFLAQGAELVLLTGGMSVDPDDLTPTAIRATGAQVITQGVPMQPGNMLMLASLPSTTLMGVPGGALQGKTTAVDVFLPRIFAGVPPSAQEVARQGKNGFCLGCAQCHYPVCYFGFV